MDCRIFHRVHPDDLMGRGVGRVQTWCETHDMVILEGQHNNRCPLGRIEEATERAISRIQAAAVEVINERGGRDETAGGADAAR